MLYTLRFLKISTTEVSTEIESIIGDFLTKKIPKKEAQTTTNSEYLKLLERFDSFEKSKDDKTEQCYYVKYEYDDKVRGMKLIVDDYYFIREEANEAVYRPCDGERFLLSNNYSKLKWAAEDIKLQLQELKLKFKCH